MGVKDNLGGTVGEVRANHNVILLSLWYIRYLSCITSYCRLLTAPIDPSALGLSSVGNGEVHTINK